MLSVRLAGLMRGEPGWLNLLSGGAGVRVGWGATRRDPGAPRVTL